MTPEEHYLAAELHLTQAETSLGNAGNRLAAASVHALLALSGNPLIESAVISPPPAPAPLSRHSLPKPGRPPRGAVA